MTFDRKEYKRRRYLKKREEQLAYYKDRYQKIYKTGRREHYRRYAQEHKQEQLAYQRQRVRTVPKARLYHLVRSHARRTVLKDGDLTREDWIEVLDQHDRKCAYCGTTENIELDHVVPLSKGGRHTKSNVQPLCRSCNARKGAK